LLEEPLDAEANQVVGGYQPLKPGREFATLDRVAEQWPGYSSDPRAGHRVYRHSAYSCGRSEQPDVTPRGARIEPL